MGVGVVSWETIHISRAGQTVPWDQGNMWAALGNGCRHGWGQDGVETGERNDSIG